MRRRLAFVVIAFVACLFFAMRPGAATGQQASSPTMALLFTVGPGWDTTKPPASQRHFASHSANLRRLREAGIIVAGGRFGAYGLILVRAPSVDSATALLRPDSSLVAKTFKVDVQPWSTIYDGAIAR